MLKAALGIVGCFVASSLCGQKVVSWTALPVPAVKRDSCTVVRNADALTSEIRILNGKESRLPVIDWHNSIALVTAANVNSAPAATLYAGKGAERHLLVRVDSGEKRNTGVFLIALDGTLGEENRCSTISFGPFRRAVEKQSEVHAPMAPVPR